MSEDRPLVSRNLKSIVRNGQTLLIDPDRPAWAIVNNLGSMIARLCNGKRSTSDIASTIAAKYGKPVEDVLRDVQAFIKALDRSGLVSFGEPKPIERVDMTEYIGPILSVAFELTERCNLQCIHCFEDAGRSCRPEPSTEDVFQWIDKFAQVPNITINLTGGEFFLRSDWRELLEHLAETGASGVILTNGTLIDNAIAQNIARISNGAPFTFQLSLDGPTPEVNDRIRGKGSFDLAMRGVQALSDYGLADRIAVSFTPNRMNIGSIDGMIDLALSRGIPILHISLLNRMGRAEHTWRKLKPTVSEHAGFYDRLHSRADELEGRLRLSGDYCSLVHTKIRRIPMPPMIGCRLGADMKVDPSGDVYPCVPMAYDKKYCIGNINTSTPGELQTSPELRHLRELFIPRIEQSRGCRSCAWKCFCAGGCMARAELNYNTVFHADDLCGIAKKLYSEGFFRLAAAGRSKPDA